MATDVSLEVQEAVYALLSADVPLAVFVGDRIFDGAPDNTKFPYITTPPFDSLLNRYKDGMGQVHDVVFDIWSRAREAGQGGASEVRNIIQAIYDIFETFDATSPGNYSGLSIASGTVTLAEITDTRVIFENDQRTFHGIVTLNVRTRSN